MGIEMGDHQISFSLEKVFCSTEAQRAVVRCGDEWLLLVTVPETPLVRSTPAGHSRRAERAQSWGPAASGHSPSLHPQAWLSLARHPLGTLHEMSVPLTCRFPSQIRWSSLGSAVPGLRLPHISTPCLALSSVTPSSESYFL